MGQWKRGAETPATRYDIPGLRTAARRQADGYVMEFLLPAAQLKHYQPKAGATIGLNVNLTVKSKRLDRELYWPTPKSAGVLTSPAAWGTMTLAE